jgi:hypothetical protein
MAAFTSSGLWPFEDPTLYPRVAVYNGPYLRAALDINAYAQYVTSRITTFPATPNATKYPATP